MRRKCGEAVGSISCCHTRVYGKVPMTKPNVDLLIEWLGHEGAVAGLDKSHLTNADLMIIVRKKGLLVDKRTARRNIAIRSKEHTSELPPIMRISHAGIYLKKTNQYLTTPTLKYNK